MARNEGQPGFRAGQNTWFVWHDGRQVSLKVRGEANEREAVKAWHRHMAGESSGKAASLACRIYLSPEALVFFRKQPNGRDGTSFVKATGASTFPWGVVVRPAARFGVLGPMPVIPSSPPSRAPSRSRPTPGSDRPPATPAGRSWRRPPSPRAMAAPAGRDAGSAGAERPPTPASAGSRPASGASRTSPPRGGFDGGTTSRLAAAIRDVVGPRAHADPARRTGRRDTAVARRDGRGRRPSEEGSRPEGVPGDRSPGDVRDRPGRRPARVREATPRTTTAAAAALVARRRRPGGPAGRPRRVGPLGGSEGRGRGGGYAGGGKPERRRTGRRRTAGVMTRPRSASGRREASSWRRPGRWPRASARERRATRGWAGRSGGGAK